MVGLSNARNETCLLTTRAIAREMARIQSIDYPTILNELGEGDQVGPFTTYSTEVDFAMHLLVNVPDVFDDPAKQTRYLLKGPVYVQLIEHLLS